MTAKFAVYLPEPIAHAVYDILIDHAGAFANPTDRERFVEYLTRPLECGTHEYRFGGSLGLGGKLYYNGGRLYVGCYREDRTPERDRIVAEANRRLAELLGNEGRVSNDDER